MKQYICNKAEECENKDCPDITPHKKWIYCNAGNCASFPNTHCIRYRHPLEVAILREIADYRRYYFSGSGAIREEYRCAAKLLYRVLKAGRKVV